MEKTDKEIKRVAFFGDADLKEGDTSYDLAVKTAELLAKNGFIIVNGGGPGIMLAATLGAKRGGGKVELVILDPKKEPNNYEGTNKKNLENADKVYETESYPKRLSKLIKIADAFVVFNGGTGTLSEVGMVWELGKFEYGHHEPVIFVGKQWGKVIEDLEEGMHYQKEETRVVAVAETPEDVLKNLV